MNYTSRSAVETYQRCKRKRYIEYFWHGRGIVPIRVGIELITGSAVHEGLASLHQSWKRNNAHIHSAVEFAISTALESYDKLWGKPESEIDLYHYKEQRALVEAILRAYDIWLLPKLMERYRVLAIEQEIAMPLKKCENISFEARPDLILQDLIDSSVLVLDYKTLANYDTRREKMISVDLQGITEAVATQYWLDSSTNDLENAVTTLEQQIQGKVFVAKVIPFLRKRLEQMPVNVTGTKMIFLLKGKRVEEKYKGQGTGKFVTSSPLIFGYEQDTPSGKLYAHSWYYPNEANQSGYSILGKGWKKFPAWEKPGGIQWWIEQLASKVVDHQTGKEIPEIQPGCGDILEKQFWLPVQRNRNIDSVASTLTELEMQETSCFDDAEFITKLNRLFTIEYLDERFPKHRHSCYYPGTCTYIDICFKKETFEWCQNDPITTGFKYRVPNHPMERKEHIVKFGEQGIKVAREVISSEENLEVID